MTLSNLQKRVLSSLVLIPVVLSLLWLGGWVFGFAAALAIAVSYAEWVALIQGMCRTPIGRMVGNVIGAMYLGAIFVALIFLRLHVPGGLEWLAILMVLVWVSDSLGYVFGKTIGGAKMSPTVSPNKTWAGYIGALLGPAVALTVFIHLLTPAVLAGHTPPIWQTFIIGGLTGCVGQSGDLLISFLKRRAGVKDTGALIPGHGGMLDRIDALLLMTLFFSAYVVLLLGR